MKVTTDVRHTAFDYAVVLLEDGKEVARYDTWTEAWADLAERERR